RPQWRAPIPIADFHFRCQNYHASLRRLGDVTLSADGPLRGRGVTLLTEEAPPMDMLDTKARDTKTTDTRTSYVFVRAGIAAAILATMFALAPPAGAQQQRLTRPATPYSSAAMRVHTKGDKGIYYGETTPKGAFPFVVALIQSEANNDEEGN